MATPPAPLSLVPPTNIYRDYFVCTETITFQGHYTAVLLLPPLYHPISCGLTTPRINMVYLVRPAVVSRVKGERRTDCAPPLIISLCPKDGTAIVTLGRQLLFLGGGNQCTNWLLTSLHQIGVMAYVPTDLVIDTELSGNTDADLLGNFISTDATVEPICVRKNIYPPELFAKLFLDRKFTPADACTCFCVLIFNGGLEVDCSLIINWIHFSLTLKTGDEKYPSAMLRPTATLADGDLL